MSQTEESHGSDQNAAAGSSDVKELEVEVTTELVGEHDLPLESSWSFWYSTKPKASTNETYDDKLQKLGTFNTLSGFFNIYAHLARPSDLHKDSNYSLFRGELKPKWETFPSGGCWNLHIVHNNKKLSLLWEQLILATIGEMFEHPSVVGVMVSKRSKEDVISVWIKSSSKTIRFHVGEKIKEIFKCSKDLPALPIEYKEHRSSMKDRSTYHNGKFYVAT
uniref:Eukaryotic translation initiation factor 4E n=1 Tax=Vannella robusta TaxID=1487602 RepID=A0A7S4IF54_9EUKA|mmetsp:Transcript_24881/g.31668  ORF Transcript_24881/g.31668 Transcript_24881/m.31668 type:complete len:220 (+) Transcript_24881:39-698(+)|eukprot:CAMPEP_0206198452 /NCGR_PEP_ID=MMETSP0166-20121206/9650_1 /ASSEMBLY_ACC=CAM_ASM_000260 /TAXON_ID=95228 /ORGANISM="Vannella robusta, Strain DIVA3 518/3/11/1/6" /LENGTH=219 /DNA_ID=CAMNT_0053616317 /DNA_START=36 /DNA_END=695 /DNA_ORIENTATION=+